MSGQAVALFNAQSAVDGMTSASFHMSNIKGQHTIQAVYTESAGTLSALVLELQGTLDNRGVADADAKWVQMATHTFSGAEITALFATFVITDQPFKRIRAKVTTLTGEGSGDALTVKYIQGDI